MVVGVRTTGSLGDPQGCWGLTFTDEDRSREGPCRGHTARPGRAHSDGMCRTEPGAARPGSAPAGPSDVPVLVVGP